MMVIEAMAEVLAEATLFLSEWMRPLWLTVGVLYFAAAVYIAVADCDYPMWTWGTFFVIAAAILVFFNIRYWVVIPVVLLLAELLLWFAVLAAGTSLFITLYSIRGVINDDTAHLPTAREVVQIGVRAIKWRLFRRR